MATESFHETETQAESVDALIKSIDNNINYFDKSAKSKSLSTNLRQLKSALEKSARAVSEIEKFMNEYDFETTKGNGYRSFQYLQISAVKSSSKVCERLINSREKMFFRADNYAKYKLQTPNNSPNLTDTFYVYLLSESSMNGLKSLIT